MLETEFARLHAPCYIYRRADIEARAAILRAALPGFGLLYSIKANPFPDIVRLLASLGFGADTSSVGEVRLAASCGIPPEATMFSAPGRTQSDLRAVCRSCLPIADSLLELEHLQRVAEAEGLRSMRIGIRIRPPFSPAGAATPTKFGIEYEQLPELYAKLRACPNLSPEVIHTHVRSQLLDADALGLYWRRCLPLATELCARAGTALRALDLGSGVGVVFDRSTQRPLCMDTLRRHAEALAEENERGPRARLLVECGRYLTCEAGTYYTPITDIKTSLGKTFVIVRNAANGFSRPTVAALFGACPDVVPAEPFYFGRHGYTVTLPEKHGPARRVTIVGDLCTNYDLIADDIELPAPSVGDLIAISHAGAYARSLSMLGFASHPEPGEYLI